jgi:hypothetical protein
MSLRQIIKNNDKKAFEKWLETNTNTILLDDIDDFEIKINSWKTYFMLALENEDSDIANRILDKNVLNPLTGLYVVDIEKKTALMYACEYGHINIIKRLIDLDYHSVLRNMRDSHLRTALDIAIESLDEINAKPHNVFSDVALTKEATIEVQEILNKKISKQFVIIKLLIGSKIDTEFDNLRPLSPLMNLLYFVGSVYKHWFKKFMNKKNINSIHISIRDLTILMNRQNTIGSKDETLEFALLTNDYFIISKLISILKIDLKSISKSILNSIEFANCSNEIKNYLYPHRLSSIPPVPLFKESSSRLSGEKRDERPPLPPLPSLSQPSPIQETLDSPLRPLPPLPPSSDEIICPACNSRFNHMGELIFHYADNHNEI